MFVCVRVVQCVCVCCCVVHCVCAVVVVWCSVCVRVVGVHCIHVYTHSTTLCMCAHLIVEVY